jgi:hypothetical protein
MRRDESATSQSWIRIKVMWIRNPTKKLVEQKSKKTKQVATIRETRKFFYKIKPMQDVFEGKRQHKIKLKLNMHARIKILPHDAICSPVGSLE